MKGKSTGLQWGTIVGNSADKGIMISRYSSSQDIRISILGRFVDIPNILNSEWNHITI